ncbi:MAG: carboxymuconolactone decarboxylase family protein [Chryseolinea sp.]
MKTKFQIPARDQVSLTHQSIYDTLEKAIGFVPNLYAEFAHSETALNTFLGAQNAKSSLTAKEKESISLVVSQVNECNYCLSSHSVAAHRNGLTDDHILEIRRGSASFNAKLNALVKLAKSISETNGHADPEIVDDFIEAGYNKGNLIDVIMLVGIRSITNYVYAITKPEIDWPLASELENA